jgi:hypothetical protein
LAPSIDDEIFTGHLAHAVYLLGLPLVDSVILAGEGRWTSLWETARSLWP